MIESKTSGFSPPVLKYSSNPPVKSVWLADKGLVKLRSSKPVSNKFTLSPTPDSLSLFSLSLEPSIPAMVGSVKGALKILNTDSIPSLPTSIPNFAPDCITSAALKPWIGWPTWIEPSGTKVDDLALMQNLDALNPNGFQAKQIQKELQKRQGHLDNGTNYIKQWLFTYS